ncbi:hypothetical protein LTR15_009241 [Elasticomyces elasticus]|nr:hypothetical protein LTR15_009241 [Elasticomyces elasticus]
MKKVEDVDRERVQVQELKYVAGFTYDLRSGTVNPINPDDAEWEDKVLVHKPSRDKQGRICLKAAYYVAKAQDHALCFVHEHFAI